MNQILSACAIVVFVGLVGSAAAAERREPQQPASFPSHIAIPEKIGEPIPERVDDLEDVRPRDVPMPIPAPGRTREREPAAVQE